MHADPQPYPDAVADCFMQMADAYKDMDAEARRIKEAEGAVPPMLLLGDVTHEIGYEGYRNSLRGIGFSVPMFAVPGNHDKELKLSGAAATQRYRDTFGPLYYSFNRGKAHFLMLDNVGVTGDGNYSREISAEELAWVEKDLSYVEKGTPLIVCGHIPFTRKKSDKKTYKPLLDLLEGYNTVLMSGHLHRSMALDRYSATVEERLHTSLGGDKWRGPVARDGTPRGYYVYHFSGTDLTWKFKPVGKDPDKNLFRMYDPEWNEYMDLDPVENVTTVVVDVWDWDENWKVTWSLDNVAQGDVPRYEEAYDPLAAYNYNSLDGESVRAVKSGHIFHCDVPLSGGEVEVVVTDRFGRTMKKSMLIEPAGAERIMEDATAIVSTDVIDMQGRLVGSYAGNLAHAGELPLSTGCYILRLHAADGTISMKKVSLIHR